MNMLCDNLALAWHDRAKRLDAELVSALGAPALWTPQRVEQLDTDGARALQQRNYWTLESMR